MRTYMSGFKKYCSIGLLMIAIAIFPLEAEATEKRTKESNTSVSENLAQASQETIKGLTGMTEEELKAYIQEKLSDGTYGSEEEIKKAMEEGKELIEQSKEEYEQLGEEIASEAKEAVGDIVKSKMSTFFENLVKQIKDFFANLF